LSFIPIGLGQALVLGQERKLSIPFGDPTRMVSSLAVSSQALPPRIRFSPHPRNARRSFSGRSRLGSPHIVNVQLTEFRMREPTRIRLEHKIKGFGLPVMPLDIIQLLAGE
jgi:hypothetical protein